MEGVFQTGNIAVLSRKLQQSLKEQDLAMSCNVLQHPSDKPTSTSAGITWSMSKTKTIVRQALGLNMRFKEILNKE
jgi:hypothetical protein